MKVEHSGHDHVLHLRGEEVALLIDILEAALPAEKISGSGRSNPSLSSFFNDVYSRLIDTARDAWNAGAQRPL
jgi:hypothetical protein